MKLVKPLSGKSIQILLLNDLILIFEYVYLIKVLPISLFNNLL